MSSVPVDADTRRPLALGVVVDQVEMSFSQDHVRGSLMRKVNFSLALKIWSDWYDRKEK